MKTKDIFKKIKQFKLKRFLRYLNIARVFGLHRYKMHVIILVVIGLFFVSNFALSRFSYRLDLSKGQAYTLTQATRKIISGLDDTVTIEFIVSSDIPSQLASLKREVTDLLAEYDRSQGKISVRIIDPKKDQKAQEKAQSVGLPAIPFRLMEQNKVEMVQGYFGIIISYKDGMEVIGQATEINSLEYDITSKIYKLTSKELPQIAIVGHEDVYIPGQDAISTLREVVGQQFTLRTATPEAKLETEVVEDTETPPPTPPFVLLPEDKTALVFDTGQRVYSDEEVVRLKEYIKNGGNVIFFVSGVWVSEQLTSGPASHNLFTLLKNYGIELNTDILLSESSELVNFGGSQFNLLLPYPAWIRTNNFNESSSYISNISQLSYLWPSSLKIVKTSGVDVHEIVRSTPETWQQTKDYILDPENIPAPKESDYKEFVVTAESVQKARGKVMVVASNKFIEDRYLSRSTNNLEFLLNVLNDYASDGALSGIRQRAVTIFPLPELSASEQEFFRYANILFLPGLFAIYGFIRIYRRSKASNIV